MTRRAAYANAFISRPLMHSLTIGPRMPVYGYFSFRNIHGRTIYKDFNKSCISLGFVKIILHINLY